MSTAIYDEALLNKIKKWTTTTKLTVLGVNETTRLFELLGDTEKDSPITLPMITLSRSRGYTIINNGTTKRAMSYNGATIAHQVYKDADDSSNNYSTTTTVQAIPISLPYQLDVFTRYAEQADILVKNLIFNIINYPSFEVEIPNSGGQKHIARIQLDTNVDDNSDVPERFVAGNFTRLSFTITVDDAYLWDVRELHDVAIDLILDDTFEPWVWNEDHTKVEFPDLSDSEHLIIPDPSSLT